MIIQFIRDQIQLLIELVDFNEYLHTAIDLNFKLLT